MPQQDASTERSIDDPHRLAEEATKQVDKHVADLRGVPMPIETEPPTPFTP